MNRISRILVTLLLALSIVLNSNITSYANESVNVTKEMIGNDSSIHVVRITNKVVSIEDGSFSGLTGLQEIIVDADNEYYASYCGCLYNKDYTVLICVPQNTSSVQIKPNVTSYTAHALDGLSQDRKDKLDQYLASGNSTNNQNYDNSNDNQVNNSNNNSNNSSESSKKKKTSKSTQDSSNFSQYVYKDGNKVCFKYTGSGESRIIIPEGVTNIIGFSDDIWNFNYDITYVYIPSSVKSMRVGNIFCSEENNWDNNGYNVLYQCPNLTTVESGASSYVSEGSALYRPLADGSKLYTWSASSRIAYDKSKYYSSGSMN